MYRVFSTVNWALFVVIFDVMLTCVAKPKKTKGRNVMSDF